jgi:hypothetical protein
VGPEAQLLPPCRTDPSLASHARRVALPFWYDYPYPAQAQQPLEVHWQARRSVRATRHLRHSQQQQGKPLQIPSDDLSYSPVPRILLPLAMQHACMHGWIVGCPAPHPSIRMVPACLPLVLLFFTFFCACSKPQDCGGAVSGRRQAITLWAGGAPTAASRASVGLCCSGLVYGWIRWRGAHVRTVTVVADLWPAACNSAPCNVMFDVSERKPRPRCTPAHGVERITVHRKGGLPVPDDLSVRQGHQGHQKRQEK